MKQKKSFKIPGNEIGCGRFNLWSDSNMEDIDAADQKYGPMQLQCTDCPTRGQRSTEMWVPHLTHLKVLNGPWNISEEVHQNKDLCLFKLMMGQGTSGSCISEPLLPWVTDFRYYLDKHLSFGVRLLLSVFSESLRVISSAALHSCPGRFKIAPCWGWWDCQLSLWIAWATFLEVFPNWCVLWVWYLTGFFMPSCHRRWHAQDCGSFSVWTQLTQ